MLQKIISPLTGIALISMILFACGVPKLAQKSPNVVLPDTYNDSLSTSNSSSTFIWKDFFNDPFLVQLIDSALSNNRELNITLQEVSILKNDIREKKGEYLPSVGLGASSGIEKSSRYTRNGSLEANNDIIENRAFPEPLPDFLLGATASWEIDIWNKLRSAKKSAVLSYLSSVEGRKFMTTNLVAEVASSYYELLALDNQLEIVLQNIQIQNKALRIVKLQKQSAKVNELAVKRFEAEVLKNKSARFYLEQKIVETENRINLLVGRLPQSVPRNAQNFNTIFPAQLTAGVPSELLANRTDIKQAELAIEAAKLNVKVAKANFYPKLEINANIGLQAFDPSYFLKTPESLLYNLAGDLIAPLVNRNAIKANYLSSNNKQIQAIYNYEQTILNAYVEVVNQLSKIENLNKSFDLKSQQVDALNTSITISTSLFQSARADYMEVLLTQRDALEAKMELVETKNDQLNALVQMYQALGGGWK
ncbi:MAG: NodT family efflux transporter outer membrane factor (OMF) lipoprotein [Vicingaceae bacterium]|jgi:NodT family efflux transporter outer membrane factor (OMF) lipoprotein